MIVKMKKIDKYKPMLCFTPREYAKHPTRSNILNQSNNRNKLFFRSHINLLMINLFTTNLF